MSIGTSTSQYALPLGTSCNVTFASNGTCLVTWYDGTNIKASYASSPYTSWTTVTVSSATGIVQSQRLDTSDTVNSVFYVSGGFDYAPLTLSGTTYSVGTLKSIATVATGGSNLMGCFIEKDPQNRYWAVTTDRVGSVITAYESTAPTSSWTANHTSSWNSDLENNFPAGGIAGNYLLYIYPTGTSTFVYDRVDVHNSSIGSWTSGTSFTPGGTSVTYDSFMSFRGNSTAGVEANEASNGIWARVYNPSTDTWATAVQLSTNGNDKRPTVIAGTDGNFYVIWQSNVGTNNNAIVYKKYTVSNTTWDSSATTLVASGANNYNPVGGSTNNILGIAYITGTASPYTVNFTTLSFLTTTPYTFSEALTVADSELCVDVALPIESIATSDSSVPADVFVPFDALTPNDFFSVSDGALLTEGYSSTDALFSLSTIPLADSLSLNDAELSTAIPLAVDALSLTDISLSTSGANAVENGSINDTLSSNDAALSSDTLSLTDSFFEKGITQLLEGLSAGDILLQQTGLSSSDALLLSDIGIGADVLVGQEALSLTDLFFDQEISSLLDAQTLTEASFENKTFFATEALSQNENAISITLFSGTDTLSLTDLFSIVEPASFVESASVSETFTWNQSNIWSEPLSLTDGPLYSSVGLSFDTVATVDTDISTDLFIMTDGLAVLDTNTSAVAAFFEDDLSASESLLVTAQESFTDSQTSSDGVLLQSPLALGDSASASEAIVLLSVLSSIDTGNIDEIPLLQEIFSITEAASQAENYTLTVEENNLETLSSLEEQIEQLSLFFTDAYLATDSITSGGGVQLLDTTVIPNESFLLTLLSSNEEILSLDDLFLSIATEENEELYALQESTVFDNTGVSFEALLVHDFLVEQDQASFININAITDISLSNEQDQFIDATVLISTLASNLSESFSDTLSLLDQEIFADLLLFQESVTLQEESVFLSSLSALESLSAAENAITTTSLTLENTFPSESDTAFLQELLFAVESVTIAESGSFTSINAQNDITVAESVSAQEFFFILETIISSDQAIAIELFQTNILLSLIDTTFSTDFFAKYFVETFIESSLASESFSARSVIFRVATFTTRGHQIVMLTGRGNRSTTIHTRGSRTQTFTSKGGNVPALIIRNGDIFYNL